MLSPSALKKTIFAKTHRNQSASMGKFGAETGLKTQSYCKIGQDLSGGVWLSQQLRQWTFNYMKNDLQSRFSEDQLSRIYLSTVLKYKFEVLVHYLSNFFLFWYFSFHSTTFWKQLFWLHYMDLISSVKSFFVIRLN